MAKKFSNDDLFESNLFSEPARQAESLLVVIKEITKTSSEAIKEQQKLLKQFGKISSLDELRKLKEAIQDVKEKTDAMLKLQKEQAKLEEKLRLSKTEQAKVNEKLRQSINEQNKATREQIKNEEALTKVIKMEVKSIQDLQEKNNALIRTRKNLDLTTKQGIADYKKLTAEISRNNAELKKHDAAIGNYQRNVGNYRSAISGFGNQLMTVLGAGSFLTIAQSAVRINAEFEQSMADLEAITGASTEQMQFFEQQALKASMSMDGSTASARDMVEAYKLIGSAKPELLGNAQALDQVAKEALLLADASGLELPDAATKLTDAMNQFGAGADQAHKFVDVLAASAKYGSAEIPQVTDALLEFGPVAKSYNISIQESAAAIEGLAEKGIKGSEAGTKLRNVMLALGAAKGLPKEAQEAFERVGIDVNILSDNSLTLNERLTELSKAQNDEVAMLKIFGKENISAAKSVLQQKDRIAELTKQVDENGLAQEQATKRTGTLSAELQKLGNAWQAQMIKMGRAGGDLAGMVRFLRQNLELILNVVMKVVKGFLVYKATVIAINLAMKSAKIAAAAYGSAMVAFSKSTDGATKSFKALDASMKANVIGLVVTAVYELADALGFFETEADRVAKVTEKINEETAKTDEALGQRQEIMAKNIDKLHQQRDEEIAIAQAKGESIDNINKKYNLKTKQALEVERATLDNLRKKEREDFRKHNEDVERLEAYFAEKGSKLTAHRAQTLGKELDDAKLNRKIAYENFLKYKGQIQVVEEQLAQNRSEARIQQAQTLGEQTNDAKNASREQIAAAQRKADEIKRIETDLRKWLEDLRVANINDERERAIAEETLAYERNLEKLQDQIKVMGKTTEEAQQIEEQLAIQHRQKLEEINKKYDKSDLDETLKWLEHQYNIKEEHATRTIKDQEKLDATLLNLKIQHLKSEIEILKGNLADKEKIVEKEIELNNLLRQQEEKNKENILMDAEARREVWEMIAKGVYDQTMKDAEAAQKRLEELAEATRLLSDELAKMFIQRSQEREALLDKEIENSQRRQDELRAMAEQGVWEADQSLAAEERKQAELERKKMEEQKRQQRIELANTAFKSLAGHIENKDASPLTSTIRDITALMAFINSLPGFYEGTEHVGEALGQPHLNSKKDGYIVRVDKDERIVDPENNKKLKGISNTELTRIVEESKSIKQHGGGAVVTMKQADAFAQSVAWHTNTEILNKFDELNATIKNKPVEQIDVDRVTDTIVKQVITGNKITRTHYKKPNLNA